MISVSVQFSTAQSAASAVTLPGLAPKFTPASSRVSPPASGPVLGVRLSI